MEKILVLIHTEPAGCLAKSAFETIGAAKNLASATGSELYVGLVGGDVAAATAEVAACGAQKIFTVSGADFGQARYASDVVAFEALVKAASATIVLAPATARLSRSLPGLAVRLNGRVDTQLTGLAAEGDKVVASRWHYRQRMEAKITRSIRPWIMTLSTGCFEAWQGAPDAAAPVEALSIALADAAKRTKVDGVKAPCADEQTIRPDAKLLFVAGAGWTKKQADGQPHLKEAEQHIWGFITQAKASLGSSKSLVDLAGEGQEVLKFMSHLHQVGQTGSTPRHPKGLATCCHGEEPHVVGWRFIKERRAVNLDAACGWAQGKADVLYVADAFAVMAKVNELLK